VPVSRRIIPGVLSAIVVVLMAACGGQAPAEKAAEPAAAPAAPTVDVKAHMDEHFTKVAEIQAAVVRGDVEGAKVGATWVADHQEAAGLPAAGQASLDEMKRAAKAVAEATDITVAAQGAADMAVACGTCHAASASKPALRPATPSAPKDEAAAHMLAHQHAVDLLYRGLVGPSDESWAEGAKALKASPLKAAQLPKAVKPSKDALKAEADTHALADRALAASAPKARAAIYAELVGGCASCHSLHGLVLGGGVPKK
jgi:mono/diheme cytochrome c family protein